MTPDAARPVPAPTPAELKRASAMGRDAHNAGKLRWPGGAADLWAMIGYGLPVGNLRSAPLMAAWLSGWDAARIAEMMATL